MNYVTQVDRDSDMVPTFACRLGREGLNKDTMVYVHTFVWILLLSPAFFTLKLDNLVPLVCSWCLLICVIAQRE